MPRKARVPGTPDAADAAPESTEPNPAKVRAAVTAASAEGTLTLEPEADETDLAEVAAEVTAAAAPEEDTPPPDDDVDPEALRAVVTAASAMEDVPEAPEVPEVGTSLRAGTVEVKVLSDVFPYIDHNGAYRSVKKGGTCKVTSAQAKRGEALGAVERV